jgi:hypothetical protein
VDVFNATINGLLRACFAALAWAPPVAVLTVISAAAGIGMLWVFKKTSNPIKIRAAKRLVYAHLLELRVFRDEPGVMWRAQRSLLGANLRYVGWMLIPALWLAVPFAVLLVHLDAYYGRAPLPVGSDTIVTMQMQMPLDSQTAAPVLETPAGVSAETPAVRILAERQVSWRIRSVAAASDDLRITVDGSTVTKRIEAGGKPRFVAGRRVSSVFEAIWHPDESRVLAHQVDWIDIRYPGARITVFGIRMHWLVWFTLISMLSALLLKRAFGVVL